MSTTFCNSLQKNISKYICIDTKRRNTILTCRLQILDTETNAINQKYAENIAQIPYNLKRNILNGAEFTVCFSSTHCPPIWSKDHVTQLRNYDIPQIRYLFTDLFRDWMILSHLEKIIPDFLCILYEKSSFLKISSIDPEAVICYDICTTQS